MNETCVYCGCAPSEHPTIVQNTVVDIGAEKCHGVYERDRRSDGEDLYCWIVRYEDSTGKSVGQYCAHYPRGQEANPNSEIIIAGWSA